MNSVEEIESRIDNSVDRLTGAGRHSQAGSVAHPAQYINDAFSFLDNEEHGAYKYFDNNHNNDLSDNYIQRDGRAPSSRPSYPESDYGRNSRQSHGQNGYAQNGHVGAGVFPYHHSSSEKDSKSQLRYLKIAIVVISVFLVLLVATVVAVVLLVGKEDDSKPIPSRFKYSLEIKINKTWEPSYLNSESVDYALLNADLKEAVNKSLKSGSLSQAYTSIDDISFRKSEDDMTLILATLTFEDTDGVYTNGPPSTIIQDELNSDLPTFFDYDVASLLVNEHTTGGKSTTTIQPQYTDPTTTAGTGFTTVPPTPPPATQEVTCITLSESLCSGYDYTHTIESTESKKLFEIIRAVKDNNCYANTERFACEVAYPKCENKRYEPVCRMYCEAFKMNCGVPIDCDGYPNDDTDCVLQPDYTPPTSPNPPSDPCNANQFRCETDPPTCIPKTQVCNGTAECEDRSDETSEAANCTGTSHTCDFNSGSVCDAYEVVELGYDFLWTVKKPTEMSTPTHDPGTLKKTDHVLLADASGRFHGAKARFRSQLLTVSSPKCFNFYYYMHGSHMGALKGIVLYSSGNELQTWFKSGDQGEYWLKGEINIQPGASRVILEAVRGTGYESDIAIDDVSITEGECQIEGCPADKFTCTNGNCQDTNNICNGRSECGDFSDENNCTCTENQFKCAMGMCIKYYQRCDSKNDCPDNSDEMDCSTGNTATSTQKCSHGRHRCGDGKCILREWICDSEDDCSTDENDCTSCADNQFKCKDNTCIPQIQVCDGTPQCSSGFDEMDCVEIDAVDIVKIGPASTKIPLCAEGLPNNMIWNSEICRLAGKGAFVMRSTMAETDTPYLKVEDGKGGATSEPFLSILKPSVTCEENNVVTITCSAKACGKPGPVSQLAGGANAATGKWPWQAAIFYKPPEGLSQFLCGAIIMGDSHVLTAAHCAAGKTDETESFEVFVGSVNKESTTTPARKVKVAEIKLYPSFKIFYLGDDIALFVLKEKLEFGSKVQPICLPDSKDSFGAGSTCYSTGWGQTESGSGKAASTILQSAKLKIWKKADCTAEQDNANIICAGYESGFIANCQGDSGGPLVCKGFGGSWSLAGIYSASAAICTQPESPPTFTRVQPYLSWIEQETACTFECVANGECLYSNRTLCDGVSDCSNHQDESDAANCSPTISCDFSSPYKCGYNNIDKAEWIRTKGSESAVTNTGPFADHTTGNLQGTFLQTTGTLVAVIVGPLYNENTPHCLFFHYFLRGTDAGEFKVFVHPVAAGFKPWELEYDQVTEASHKFSRSSHQVGVWLRGRVDVAAGTFVLGFVGRPTDNNPTVGLDDVKLVEGTCASLDNTVNGCEDGETVCTGSSGDNLHFTCISDNLFCNSVKDCVDTGSDETNLCQSDTSYSCDMENMNECGIVQQHTDKYDWRLIQAGQEADNHPDTDATTPNKAGGHFLSMDTSLLTHKGANFLIQLSSFQRTATSCLSFKYIKHTKSRFMVSGTNVGDQPTLLWEAGETPLTDWKMSEVEISDTIVELVFTGSILDTNAQPLQKDYIAIDDISFTNGRCANAECLNSTFRCNDGTCIKLNLFCDGNSECPGSGREDEPIGCECNEGYFPCTNRGGCLEMTDLCNGVEDCLDGSDEKVCDCHSSDDFVCTSGKCINKVAMKCNNVNDCGDFSDEKECLCDEASKFSCGTGFCIASTKKCDGIDDCGDASDEINCDVCPSWQTKCTDGSKCFLNDWECDGWEDCDDGSDEANCDTACPAANQDFRCSSPNVCITKDQRCDGNDDCINEMDEKGCGSASVDCLGSAQSCDCGALPSPSGIVQQLVGGAPVGEDSQHGGPDSWPWSCALYIFGKMWCGCVVLSDRWVATAAHCFYLEARPNLKETLTADPSYITLVLGSNNRSSSNVKADQVIIHEDYQNNPNNPINSKDIALVRINSAETLPSGVKPVCLPTQDQVFTQNSYCFTIGWGWRRKTNDDKFKQPPIMLNEAKVRIRDGSACQQEWAMFPPSNDNVLCVGYKTAVIYTCGGDSGSPMMCRDTSTQKWQLAGLVSAGHACSESPEDPHHTVFVNVGKLRTWIDDKVNGNT